MADIIRLSEEEKQVPQFYSNVFEIVMGAFDLTFIFGTKTTKQMKEKKKDFDENVKISMSPQQAKASIVVLKEMLNRYEKDLGVIPIPPDFKERYKKLFGDK